MNDKYQVKAVIFDLGRVLVNVDMTRGLFRRVRDQYPDDDVALMEKLFQDDLFRNFARGKTDPRHFYGQLCERYQLSTDYATFVAEWCDVFAPMDDIESVFFDLRDKFTLGLLSDVDPLHWQYLYDFLPFLSKIEKPTLSFQTGYLKPDNRVYPIAAEHVNQPLHNCLFIDDRSINVEGAKRAGMQAVQFLSVAQLESHLKSRNLL